MLGLQLIKRYALTLLIFLTVSLAVVVLVAVFFQGKSQAVAAYEAEQTKVLQNEIKKNAKAKAIADAVELSDDSAVSDWLQHNGFFRED